MATVDEEARVKILDVSGEEIESAVIKALNSATDIAVLKSEIDSKLNKEYFNQLSINVKMLGAIGDSSSHKLSTKYSKLEAAQVIYPCATSLDDEIDWCAIQTALDNFNTTCIPKGGYHLNKPLKMRFNTNLIGVNSGNTALKFTRDVYKENCIVYGDTYSYSSLFGKIEGLYIEPLDDTQPPYGIGIYSAIRLKDVCMYETLTFLEKLDSRYMDNINIDRCDARYCKGDSENKKYVIHINGENDNLKITNCRMGGNSSDAYTGIYITYNRGGIIKDNIFGCSVTVEKCDALEISNLHMENVYSKIRIVNSSVICSNIYKWKRINGSDFEVVGGEGYASHTNTVLSLKNVTIDMQVANLKSYGSVYELERTGKSIINIENCFKTINYSSTWTVTTPRIGFRIKDNTKFNLISQVASIKSIINQNNQITTFRKGQYKPSINLNYMAYSNVNNNISWLIPETNKTYVYIMIGVVDEDRKLAFFLSEKKTITGVGKNGVLLQITDAAVESLGCSLRIYRGNVADKYSSYVNLPLVMGSNFFDYGTHIMGVKWAEISEPSSVDTYNYIDSFEYLNGGNNIKFSCSSIPTIGTFAKGDICVNTSMSSGSDISWIYNGSTWKSTGQYI